MRRSQFCRRHFRFRIFHEGRARAAFQARPAGGEIRLWEAASGRALQTLPLREPRCEGLSLAYSPDGASLASGLKDGRIVIWTPAVAALGANGGWFSVAFSPDSRYLAGGTYERAVRVFDLSALPKPR
jgi:WD40 repeat protein